MPYYDKEGNAVLGNPPAKPVKGNLPGYAGTKYNKTPIEPPKVDPAAPVGVREWQMDCTIDPSSHQNCPKGVNSGELGRTWDEHFGKGGK